VTPAKDASPTLDKTASARGGHCFSLPALRYAAAGGAVPLRVHEASVVGQVGVSGLPQLDDHSFVVRILRGHVSAMHGA
jgi:uncharacterized protein (UPF0303 family)